MGFILRVIGCYTVYVKRRAFYPGSFDPITNGHLDVVKRASSMFDELVVAVIQNPSKEAFFSLEDRIEMVSASVSSCSNVTVEGFQGLLVDFAIKSDIFTVLRGLRAVSDFEYELQMSLTNRAIEDKLETVFLMTDAKYSFISSSLIRQLSEYGGSFEQFVPSYVEQKLKEKFQQ